MLIERLGEHCAEREIGGTLYRERDWGNTIRRERLGEQYDERDWGKIVLRERLGEHCAERVLWEHCTEIERDCGTLC